MNPNIATIQDPLALAIRNDLAREATNRQEWIAIKVSLCRRHDEAKRKYGDLVSFGRWFDENVGDLISKDERAAYVAMGAQLETAKQILTATTRNSIEMIYRKEFLPRFRSAPKTAKPRRPQVTDEYEAAMGIIERRAAAGESLSYTEIEQEAGISSTAVRRALAAFDAKQEHATDFGKFLASSAKEKLDRAIAQYKKKLDQEYSLRLNAEVKKYIAEKILPGYGEKLAKADKLLAAQDRGHYRVLPFTPQEYRAILSALHPDDSSSPERKAELFRLFKSKEDKLKMPVADAERLGRMPTYDELMARAEETRAENRRRAKEAAAKRKAAKS
jgi:hypothetical protein